MGIWQSTATGLMTAMLIMGVAWVVSILRHDASVADIFWGIAIAAVALGHALIAPDGGPRTILVLAMVLIWAIRLSGYVFLRNYGKPEDRRYRDMRQRHDPGFWWKSAFIVFALQAVLAIVISMPVPAAMRSTAPLGIMDWAGAALWLVGMYFEAVSDHQLARYLRQPRNHDSVMDRGLWRYSRHPNYFGEACIWWGIFLVAAGGGAWWSIAGPALLTWFLLRVSGVALTEKDIATRRPAYEAYVRRTSAFIPRPPRRVDDGRR